VRRELLNSQGKLHGGVAYALADSGMGLSLYSSVGDDERVATLEVQIVYFKAVTSGTLTCNAKVVHRSKRLGTVEAELRNDGHPVAKALGTFSISKRKTTADTQTIGEPSPGESAHR
jgi:acyl-CoA thioesterase